MRKAQIAALTVATLAVASAYYGLADSLDLVPGPLSAASSSYRPQPYPTPSAPDEDSGVPSGLDADAPAPTTSALSSLATTLSSDPMVGKATTTVTVSAGQTLWDIAAATGRGDVMETAALIVELNHLSGTTLRPGQRLIVPRG